jgi:hypothetical protein
MIESGQKENLKSVFGLRERKIKKKIMKTNK